MQPDIILAAGQRTAFGDFGRSLKDIPLTAMATHAARACLAKGGVEGGEVDHLVYGNTMPVDHDGLFASRVIALNAGLSEDSSALMVSRACGTGSQAIASAAEQITLGRSELALAGGAENYSRAPYVVNQARWGLKRGQQPMEDALDFCYRDPFNGEYMGETAENLAEEYQYEREPMDEWALMSQQRAGAAIGSGFLARQIVPIEVPDGRSSRLFDTDEFPRPDITPQRLSQLRPAFRDGGKVTPGNSSGVTDGAAFLLVAARRRAAAVGLRPEARLVDWVTVGVPPRIMGIGPVPAIGKLLQRVDLTVDDIDYFEINEAFAVVNLHAERHLSIPRERTNLYGGGISIGHPPGATGVRMTITAMHHLADIGGRYAVVAMCLGAGQGMATLIENIPA
ncbi:MAG: thiolase family protein [Alphaproteobacteria bacterium]|jgi:acetyl-CoA acetyltransferase family protein|nr:thiolase family protein [Alphaproteobacteria bacterium]MDP6812773.1 thiolase family protein [Alphaproteobacteria bacterium]